MKRSTADLPGRSEKRIRVAISRWTSKVSRSSARPGDEVEVAAHRPEEIVGAVEAAIFLRG